MATAQLSAARWLQDWYTGLFQPRPVSEERFEEILTLLEGDLLSEEGATEAVRQRGRNLAFVLDLSSVTRLIF